MTGQIYNPVGLDIGAESPEQIALAILAEIQAVISGHAGGLLREKKASIHTPIPAS
jgi:xanthine/CO dehydrogenase XdhC/CoxF family maturation factor